MLPGNVNKDSEEDTTKQDESNENTRAAETSTVDQLNHKTFISNLKIPSFHKSYTEHTNVTTEPKEHPKSLDDTKAVQLYKFEFMPLSLNNNNNNNTKINLPYVESNILNQIQRNNTHTVIGKDVTETEFNPTNQKMVHDVEDDQQRHDNKTNGVDFNYGGSCEER